MISLKLQIVHGTSPHLHDWDQRGDKFSGSAQGDEHATIFEIDPIAGTVGDFLKRLTGRAAQFVLPVVSILATNPEQDVLGFIEDHGQRINDQLKAISFQGNSLRIALMDGKEE